MKKALAILASGWLAGTAWVTPVVAAPEGETESSQTSGTDIKALAPEFGPSVKFDGQDPAVQLSDLRGKMVLVVFFQSWCPICNQWAPDFYKQLTEAYGNDRSVALVGMYTDGNAAEAKRYLMKHGADVSKWIVASDFGGVYYQRVSGGNSLYGFMVVDPEGRVAEKGEAGRFYNRPEGKSFVLADQKFKDKHITGAKPLLPADADYGPDLAVAVRVAETGNFRLGLQGAKIMATRPKTKDAATKLLEDLTAKLSERVTAWTAAVKGSDAAARYDAYRNLKAVSLIPDAEPAKAAKALVTELRADKDLQKEERAEMAYWGIYTRAIRLNLQQRKAQLGPALQQFATVHKGTVYADRATAEAETISGGASE